MLWRLKYSRETSNYVLDSLPYNEVVVNAIQRLAIMPSPYPPGIIQADVLDILIWRVAEHEVYYLVNEETLTITILAIHPR